MRIELQLHDNVVSAIEKIKASQDAMTELEIPEGSVLFDNSINLRLLRKEAEKAGKTVSLRTEDRVGKEMIAMLEVPPIDSFVSKEVPRDLVPSLPKLKLGDVFANVSLPRINGKIMLAGLILIGGVTAFSYLVFWKVPKADVKIVVNSQPLIKSVGIKVVDGAGYDGVKRIIGGKVVSTTVVGSSSVETTGEKVVGERASGRVKIFNKTTGEIKLKKGTEVTYKGGSSDLIFELKGEVVVGPVKEEIPGDPSKLVSGEASVDIEAVEIGEDYNIDGEKTLEFDDYKTSELVAQTDGETKGGDSRKVKVVAEEDRINVSARLLEESGKEGEKILAKSLDDGQELVQNSHISTITSEEYSADIGDDIEKLELTQNVLVAALSYSSRDIDNLVDELVREFIPDGFIQSSEERNVNVEILGNTDSSVLSASEADLQVTLKSFVIPDLKEDEIKRKLAGKKLSEAQKVLGGIRNVKNYELKIDPNIPFFQRLPKNAGNISVEIARK